MAYPSNTFENPKKLAVLIDADNVQSAILNGLLDEIAKFGIASVKRIYGDWTSSRMSGWKESLLKYSIQPIQQFFYTTGKNSTDSAMIIDAMDLLHTNAFDGFCLISSDSDFTRLAARIRESGIIVYGFGEKKTPEAFRQACDQFIYTENLRSIATSEKKEDKIQSSLEPKEDLKIVNVLKKDDQLIYLIRTAVDDSSDDTGWAFLGTVGNNILNRSPDFDSRTYGFRKLSDLIKSLDLFDIEERQPGGSPIRLIYVRNKLQD
jgi:uncharacterized LabA/DUF88 family protein